MNGGRDPGPTIHLAHDGSLHCEWVARYALRFAAGSPDARLVVLHVASAPRSDESLAVSVGRLAPDAERLGVDLVVESLPRERDVARALEEAVPATDRTILLCAARAKESGRGLLAGTVSETLLLGAHRNVLAIRVLAPGLLGAPHVALYPTSEKPSSAARAGPFLRLLAPALDELVLMRVMCLSPWEFQHLTAMRAARLRDEGRGYLERFRLRIHADLAGVARFDTSVVVSDDWPKEIVIEATRRRSQVVLLGATRRTLPRRRFFGNPIEQVLRRAPCDVAVFRRGET